MTTSIIWYFLQSDNNQIINMHVNTLIEWPVWLVMMSNWLMVTIQTLFREVWKLFVIYSLNLNLCMSVCMCLLLFLFLSGEVGFRAMCGSLGWAKNPMIQRVNLVPSSMPVTMVYGSRSWVDSSTGSHVAQIRGQSPTRVVVSLTKRSLHSAVTDSRTLEMNS